LDQNQPRALITGVSSGLGLALAEYLLEQGWTVYGLSRRPPQNIDSPDFHFRAVDLADFERAAAATLHLLEFASRVELVVLNAGALGPIADIKDVNIGEMQRVFDVNLWANKAVLDALFLHGRRVQQVIAISSGASVNPARGWNAYGVSKAALNMFIQLYALEAPETHFVSLAPGLVDTAMQEHVFWNVDFTRFPGLLRLKEARGTEQMQSPAAAARRIFQSLPKLRTRPSGTYVDIRKLDESPQSLLETRQ
jgi:benzil reductase ((S)-benzoin forming)